MYPNWGAVVRRADLDGRVAALAAGQGAVLLTGTEARPLLEEGRIGGVALHHGGEVEVVRPALVVVADGALSRFGRALGARRDHGLPFGLGRAPTTPAPGRPTRSSTATSTCTTPPARSCPATGGSSRWATAR